MKTISLLIWSILGFYTFGYSASPSPSVEKLAETFLISFNKGETNGLRESCHSNFWFSIHDNPRKLIKQGFLNKRVFYLSNSGITPAKERAVVEYIVISAESKRPVDSLYFYAEATNSLWLFHGMNEDKLFREKFLSGLINGQFHPMDLPANAELAALGKELQSNYSKINDSITIEEFNNLYKDKWTIGENLKKNFSPYLLTSVKKPTSFESHWSVALNRGVLFVSEEKTLNNAYPEKFYLTFSKSKNGWELLRIDSYPSLSGILE